MPSASLSCSSHARRLRNGLAACATHAPARAELGEQARHLQSKLVLPALLCAPRGSDATVAAQRLHEAAERCARMNGLSFACRPGAPKTDLQRHASPAQQRLAAGRAVAPASVAQGSPRRILRSPPAALDQDHPRDGPAQRADAFP
ncbi:hypothetical protein PHLGIDRAFT_130490 [Phlebiopsis gigantea 11061_1 CR5-6]|uniref:Uncharacterized protein n=1 Tax=Phlebiopsis gigantea (strain 11061_1 CR5-6) TaxID=745531 RepID=A0A0C3S144_PHLG1|nr:hypothetical protein PHLGIDRAFT_130490 [Phlebiopsis gigantea 11061_1 CR5-6]